MQRRNYVIAVIVYEKEEREKNVSRRILIYPEEKPTIKHLGKVRVRVRVGVL